MKKHLLMIVFFLLVYRPETFSQYSEQRRTEIRQADSLKIEKLKTTLPSMTGTELVDSLNSLAGKYGDINGSGGFVHRFDSAYRYMSLANNEAEKIRYKKGIAHSLIGMANLEFISLRNASLVNISSKSPAVIKDRLQQATRIGEELNDNKILGAAYLVMSKTENSIEAMKKAYEYFRKDGDIDGQALMATWLCEAFSFKGQYEEGVDYCQVALNLNKDAVQKRANSEWGHTNVFDSYSNLSSLFEAAGDYETAMSYYVQARHYAALNSIEPANDVMVARLFIKMKQIDSALYYIERFKNKNMAFVAEANFLLAKIALINKDYDKTINILSPFIDTMRKRSMKNPLIEPLLDIAKAHLQKGNYRPALKYAEEGTAIALEKQKRPNLLTGYELLSKIHYNLGKGTTAYQYLSKYINLKDSIQSHQFLWKLNNYKKLTEEERKTSQINLLNKDNQLKEQKLNQQATVKNSLVIGITLVVLLGIFIFRNLSLKRKSDRLRMQKDFELQKIESEKKQAELHQRAIELEMQALRAQMNPHFIFNCLSSINRFIFKNDNKTASDYLTRFSRLIRMVLMHSQKKMIPLEDELEMIRLYLDLERLRFKDAFDYSITTTNIVDAGTIFIPPLLLQPFCENAVWHGLMHKETKGHLNVIISEVVNENDKTLYCVIEDNGVGRDKAAEMNSKSAGKEKSLGLKITTERIALLNKENNFNTFYKIDDIINDEHEVAGTRVQLKIKYKESIEEYA